MEEYSFVAQSTAFKFGELCFLQVFYLYVIKLSLYHNKSLRYLPFNKVWLGIVYPLI